MSILVRHLIVVFFHNALQNGLITLHLYVGEYQQQNDTDMVLCLTDFQAKIKLNLHYCTTSQLSVCYIISFD